MDADKWDGEDEDDSIKDNWDDEEEEEEVQPVTKTVTKKKVSLAERIKEKEERKREERLKREAELQEEPELSPEEARLRQQLLVEESDLEMAKEAFGVTDVIPGQKTLDNFVPSTKDDFTEYARMLTQKLTSLENSSEYIPFLEILFRDCCVGADSDEIKKLSSTLNILATEKQKVMKGPKGKKKTNKKSLGVGKASGKDAMADMSYDNYDEFDDFM